MHAGVTQCLFSPIPADDSGDLRGCQLPRVMLLMHRWYVTSTELAGKLLTIYPLAGQVAVWEKVCKAASMPITIGKHCYGTRHLGRFGSRVQVSAGVDPEKPLHTVC